MSVTSSSSDVLYIRQCVTGSIRILPSRHWAMHSAHSYNTRISTTKHIGILSQHTLRTNSELWRHPQASTWAVRPCRWVSVASWKRWAFCNSLWDHIYPVQTIYYDMTQFLSIDNCCNVWAPPGIQFFRTSIGSIPSIRYIMSLDFGAINPRSISNLIHSGVTHRNWKSPVNRLTFE